MQDGLFSFEAGRKTVSPGVFAFKCRRAEKLFNCLQVRVREQGQDRSASTLALATTTAGNLTPDDEDEQGTEQGAYINYNIATTPSTSTPPYLNITQELPNTSQDGRHEYENIEPGLQSPDYLPARLVLPPKPPHLQPSADNQQDTRTAPGQSVNYIVLDLDTAVTNNTEDNIVTADTTAATTDTTTRGRGYVTIDFDKTDALIKSANQRYVLQGDRKEIIQIFLIRFFDDDDPGTRKTRHNSSLSDLAPVKLVN